MKYILKQKSQVNNSPAVIDGLRKELKLSKLTAALLCARGITSPQEAQIFLNPDISQLRDPFLFANMHDAVSAVRHTIATKGKICIYGDYDADGISASAILYKTLNQMGAKVEVFLPNRMEHGYGLTLENIERLQGISLLITVDCGITSTQEIDRAKELGMTTILTDHHECPHVLPKADYILNPKCPDETYPYHSLCGAGVAFKFAQALIGDAALEMIDIAALATIADIVPLLGENRTIAALGLKKLNEDPNPGINALVKKACVKRTSEIDAQTVSFVLAPRINAAGRISTAKTAFELLTENDPEQLEGLAEKLCTLNIDRQQRQERVVAEAMQMQEATGDPGDKIIILYKNDWDIGIVGLAASKVSERYVKPTILLGESEPGIFTGSARSIPGVNIYEALNSQATIYEKFGGHAGAAGLTIKEEYIRQLKHRLNEFLKEHYEDDIFKPLKMYDLKITPAEVSNSLIAEFETMRPFGFKNEQIELLIEGAHIEDIRAIGEDKHAKFQISKNGKSINAVIFGTQAVDVPRYADVVGTLNINTFDMKPQMIVNTLSYEETPLQKMKLARTFLQKTASPCEADCKTYFLDRETLLRVYTVLKKINEKAVSFADEGSLAEFVQKYVAGLTENKTAFALSVFEELGLLEMKKDDKIHIVIHSGKHELSDSRLYQKFGAGEN
ncbi:single-stranded-DNA-specific exonuclease RecJ [Christensenella tenuis]|jgi:single-stranded-DNA-specific exonuclease|uniref:Single-stranded-DNA-specific exonuclease RecJ n=1 Tax=Christensenella tenuis TaxID=2763033 RepID=A0ABR7EBH5_9FIRM|nr:single-stranded-DNA-specific exonuclease RecJ [Christensenella tenuis]MBC5647101.1 single-stranded-DNA-specific exonuclease RecJ [Christensenella tenuis]